jgi:phosphate transport system protein
MSIGDQHIVKSFDEELGRLKDAVSRMSGLAESQLAAAVTALTSRDDQLAARVIEDDAKVDDLEAFVNEQTVRLLVLRSPVANDLRAVISTLKVASDIERIADLAANAAKRSLVLNHLPPQAPLGSVLRLARVVQEMLTEVLDAFLSHDAERALVVRQRDEEVDDIYSSLFREILTYMMEDPRTITAATHLMFIAKNMERIGDHATNIAEMTYFMVTGRRIRELRRKRDDSAFVGADPVV